MRLAVVATTTLVLFSFASTADEFDKALSAYDAGGCATALQLTTALAHKGNAHAESLLGKYYFEGTCGKPDYNAAAHWFALAAKRGDAFGEYALADLYYDNGVYHAAALEADNGTAEMVRLYMASARQGYSPAQNWIAAAFSGGTNNFPTDLVRAYMWFTLAMRTGDQEDHDLASQNRDTITLTMEQIETATTLCDVCQRTHYADCGDSYGRVRHSASLVRLPLKNDGNTFIVPVGVNGVMTLDFVLDSGASDVGIPADVVSTLIRIGSISSADFLSTKRYILADGSTLPSATFRIKTLRLGTFEAHNVTASVLPVQASPLLGQSLLVKFGSWTINNKSSELILQ